MELEFEHLTRQLKLIPLDVLDTPITIIGAGAVGSFTTLSLAKMGFNNITVFDFDSVSVENMNCQFYRFKDIGKQKVVALKELVKEFSNIDIKTIDKAYEKDFHKGIVISAVDSMKVRQMIWDNHKELAYSTKLLIDPRMGAEEVLIYAMDPMNQADIKSYEKSLYKDEDAVQEECTAKATVYTAAMLAGQVCKIVKDFTTKTTPYARITQWSIAKNAYISHASGAK